MSDDPTMHESQKQTLKTARCLRVPVLDEDEAIIKTNAKSVGLSTAEYSDATSRDGVRT
ncbi:MAG TPA: hypothetical protein VFN67_10365 [Polyangiales bacterium]|jgi:hypothetical protein|nr:hypothetical protein [Polyangiales bacterium]